MEHSEHPSYVTTMTSIGGSKAVLMKWTEDCGGFYEPWNTGPGMKNPEMARIYAKEWAKAEEIEYL